MNDSFDLTIDPEEATSMEGLSLDRMLLSYILCHLHVVRREWVSRHAVRQNDRPS
jgi:hypothetical protein